MGENLQLVQPGFIPTISGLMTVLPPQIFQPISFLNTGTAHQQFSEHLLARTREYLGERGITFFSPVTQQKLYAILNGQIAFEEYPYGKVRHLASVVEALSEKNVPPARLGDTLSVARRVLVGLAGTGMVSDIVLSKETVQAVLKTDSKNLQLMQPVMSFRERAGAMYKKMKTGGKANTI